MASTATNNDKITEEGPTVWHMDDTKDTSPKKSVVKKVSVDESSTFGGSEKSSGHTRRKSSLGRRRRQSGSRAYSESIEEGSSIYSCKIYSIASIEKYTRFQKLLNKSCENPVNYHLI